MLTLSALGYRTTKIKPSKKILGGEAQQLLDKYIEADLIVSSGGGFLNDSYPLSCLIPNLFQLLLAIILNKPVVTYPQSIGPFRSTIYRLLTKWMLNRLDLILLREPISKAWLDRMGVTKPKILITADAAFVLRPVDAEQAVKILLAEGIKKDGHTLVGMTVIKWAFPNLRDGQIRYARYVKSIAEACDYLIERFCARVVLIPQVSDPSGGGDWVTTREVYGMLRGKEEAYIVAGDYWPQELQGIMGQMELFIGTRMHSNIFALTMEVPTIAIAYEHKTEGIMSMLELQHWVLPINSLEPERLVSKVEELWEQRDSMRRYLASKIPIMRDLAATNATIMKEYWDVRKQKA